MKTMISILFALGLTCTACAKIPIPAASQVQAATIIGCAVLKESGCYDELATVFPGMQESTCPATLEALLKAADELKEMSADDVARLTSAKLSEINNSVGINYELWDPSKVDVQKIVKLRNGSCAKLTKALGVK